MVRRNHLIQLPNSCAPVLSKYRRWPSTTVCLVFQFCICKPPKVLRSHRKSHKHKALKRYWKLIQQESRKLSDKRFYLPTFRSHLTNKEILENLLAYSQELREHYDLYQLLLFHFQEKQADHLFELIEETISCVNPIFQTVFKTFLKDKGKIINALEPPYSNAKLEATNNLIKIIKRNAFGFRNFKTSKLESSLHWTSKRREPIWSSPGYNFPSTHYSWQRAVILKWDNSF